MPSFAACAASRPGFFGKSSRARNPPAAACLAYDGILSRIESARPDSNRGSDRSAGDCLTAWLRARYGRTSLKGFKWVSTGQHPRRRPPAGSEPPPGPHRLRKNENVERRSGSRSDRLRPPTSTIQGSPGKARGTCRAWTRSSCGYTPSYRARARRERPCRRALGRDYCRYCGARPR